MLRQTVLIIGPQASCESIDHLVHSYPQFEVVGKIISAGGLHLVGNIAPDIIILDCAAPQINPLIALPELCTSPSAPQIIALGVGAGERSLLRALGAAAYAISDQPESLQEALAAIGVNPRSSSPARPAAQLRARTTPELAHRHARHAQ
jgi:DNA-binding NarL/FixJ family response regulator